MQAGMGFMSRGLPQEAISKFREALAETPDDCAAHACLGDACAACGRHAEAISAYEKALEFKPGWFEIYSAIAIEHMVSGHEEEGLIAGRSALALKPTDLRSISTVAFAQQRLCEWTDYEKILRDMDEAVRIEIAAGRVPYVQPWQASIWPFDPQVVLGLTRLHAEKISCQAAALGSPTWTLPPRAPLEPGQRLRIGYVSSEFADHPVGHLMGSVFGLHDRSRYEIFCYAVGKASDRSRYRARIEATTEHFLDASTLDIMPLAQRIVADGIHILVNINGFTRWDRNEVFALRVAPVQIQFLGFPASMGGKWTDYSVADTTVAPAELHRCYAEPLALMPHSMIPTDHKHTHASLLSLPPLSRTELGLPEHGVVYLCNNQLFKIDPTLFQTWCNILKRVPGSVLWLIRSPADAEPRLKREAENRGVDPARIVFTDRVAKEIYLHRSTLADVFLDTRTYNAYTTGSDALWAGCPMLTFPGERMASRSGASLCQATGLGEDMIATSAEDYEEKAVLLGNDPGRLQDLKRRLAEVRHSCPLFDVHTWTRDFERLHTALWGEYAANQHRSFQIPALPQVPAAQRRPLLDLAPSSA